MKPNENINILVAEDDITNQHLIKAIAKNKRWNVNIVDNGKKAVEEVDCNNYDLILMDIQMPEMTGIEATKAIRIKEDFEKKEKRIPIIALTAYAMLNDRQKCIDAGMDGYITKPINFKDLFDTIDKFIK